MNLVINESQGPKFVGLLQQMMFFTNKNIGFTLVRMSLANR